MGSLAGPFLLLLLEFIVEREKMVCFPFFVYSSTRRLPLDSTASSFAVPHRGLGGEASTKIDPTRQPTTIPTHMNAVGAFAIKALRANYAGQRRCEDPLCKDEECEVVSGSSQQEDTEPGGSGWVWVVVAVVVVVGARARVCVYASSTVSA